MVVLSMIKQNVYSDKEILEILFNKKELNHQELDSLLYRLFHAGDNPESDTLQRYTHLTWYDYNQKMSKILKFIYDFCDYLSFYDCKEISCEDIRNLVGVLPNYALIDFLQALDNNKYIIIDFDEDFVYNCDYLLDILKDTILKEIINDVLYQEDINEIIKFINDLDLFDIELYQLYNEVK